jgi:hypothetical protein
MQETASRSPQLLDEMGSTLLSPCSMTLLSDGSLILCAPGDLLLGSSVSYMPYSPSRSLLADTVT